MNNTTTNSMENIDVFDKLNLGVEINPDSPYIQFVRFVVPKLKKNYIKEINVEADLDKLIVFKPDNGVYVINLDSRKFIEFLHGINLGVFSFYFRAHYTLDRLYERMTKDEQKQLVTIIHNININGNKKENIASIIHDSYISALETNKKFDSLVKRIYNGEYSDPVKLASMIDDVFLDDNLKEQLITYVSERFKLIELMRDKNILDCMDVIMNINPTTNIYYQQESYVMISMFIKKVIDNSVCLKNVEFELNERNKDTNIKEFKRKYILKKMTKNDQFSDLDFLNNIDNIFDGFVKKKYRYTKTKFIQHMIMCGIKLYNSIIHIKMSKEVNVATNLVFDNLNIKDMSNIEKSEIDEYINVLKDIITDNKVEKIDLILDFYDNNQVNVKNFIMTNKDNVKNIIEQSMVNLGLTRSREILSFIKEKINFSEFIPNSMFTSSEDDPENKNKIKNIIKNLLSLAASSYSSLTYIRTMYKYK